MSPTPAAPADGICPECGKPLTIGVAHRVAELADRPAGYRPPGAPGFTSLVQLRQIVGEIVATGPASKKVATEVSRLVGALGPELGILCDVPMADVERAGGSVLAEAVARLRRGAVTREAGYDGEYGTVRLFRPGELDGAARCSTCRPRLRPAPRRPTGRIRAAAALAAGPTAARIRQTHRHGRAAADGLRRGRAQRADELAADGSGATAPSTGATGAGRAGPRAAGGGRGRQPADDRGRAGHRQDPDADPPDRRAGGLRASRRSRVLAVTFTRRAAEEMRARLAALGEPPAPRPPAPGALAGVTVTTFHGLGLRILRELHDRAGLPADFQVADEAAWPAVAAELSRVGQAGRDLLAAAAGDQAAREAAGQGAGRAGPGGLRRADRAAGGPARAATRPGRGACASAGR